MLHIRSLEASIVHFQLFRYNANIDILIFYLILNDTVIIDLTSRIDIVLHFQRYIFIYIVLSK